MASKPAAELAVNKLMELPGKKPLVAKRFHPSPGGAASFILVGSIVFPMQQPTMRGYLFRAAPLMLLIGILCVLFGGFGAMTASMSGRYHDYQSKVLMLHGAVLACYLPSFPLMFFSLRAGIRMQWCLIAIGVLLFLVSGLKDGLVVVSILSFVIPTLGGVVLEMRAELPGPAV